MPPSELDTLAQSLAGTLPGCDNAPLALAVVRELAKGEPVATSTLAGDSRETLARWPNVDYNTNGDIVAFSGLSLVPTPHRFTVEGRALYTWCAWDTLFLPAMLGRSADVTSVCPVTGRTVRLTVDPDGIGGSDPSPLWVSFPPGATSSTADITGTFCCHVHFLASATAAQQWLSEHAHGTVLDLHDAYILGREATRCFGG